MYSKKLFFIFLFLSMVTIPGMSQQAILSSAGNAAGDSGTVTSSIGQVTYMFYIATDGSNSEGVQQPYEIQIIGGIEQEPEINLEFILYPNPTTAFIKLKTNKQETRLLTYELRSIEGLLLRNDKIENAETTIPIDNISPATYLLNVSDHGQLVKTFKVIKK